MLIWAHGFSLSAHGHLAPSPFVHAVTCIMAEACLKASCLPCGHKEIYKDKWWRDAIPTLSPAGAKMSHFLQSGTTF